MRVDNEETQEIQSEDEMDNGFIFSGHKIDNIGIIHNGEAHFFYDPTQIYSYVRACRCFYCCYINERTFWMEIGEIWALIRYMFMLYEISNRGHSAHFSSVFG